MTERVKLLTHIFRQLHKTHGVTAEMLREAALDHHRKIDVPLRREVLDELYRVKEHEEALYRSEIGKLMRRLSRECFVLIDGS